MSLANCLLYPISKLEGYFNCEEWFPGGICVNTAQLTLVRGKSKSWINACFARLGYEPAAVSYAADGELLRAMPFLAPWPRALRQWSLRRARAGPPADREAPAAEDTDQAMEPCHYGCFCGCNCRPPGANERALTVQALKSDSVSGVYAVTVVAQNGRPLDCEAPCRPAASKSFAAYSGHS
jgi:hypothetical protein